MYISKRSEAAYGVLLPSYYRRLREAFIYERLKGIEANYVPVHFELARGHLWRFYYHSTTVDLWKPSCMGV